MSNSKVAQDDQDPDYATPGPSDETQQKLYEENARTNVARRITAIVEKEFSQEIDAKEKEILQIEARLQKALKTLHFLRYVIITDFYNRKQCQAAQATCESKQSRIHPAIKQIIGKTPKKTELFFENSNISPISKNTLTVESTNAIPVHETPSSSSEIEKRLGKSEENSNDNFSMSSVKNFKKRHDENSHESEDDPPRKMPRYVPPKSGIPEPQVPSRGARHKVRKRIVVGNISKWIPPDWREDAASHKWTIYVRGSKENADIADFVGKIRFFLHPSYRPNDVVEVTSPPFHLSRRGWGEFPVRVQLHFKDPLNKPTDIIHYLKLDRTYTGLQTLGSETVVDVWIKISPDATYVYDSRKTDEKNEKIENRSIIDINSIKQEPADFTKTLKKENEISDISEMKNENEESIKYSYIPSYVDLEHDYANMTNRNIILSENEKNVTISHSPKKIMKKNEESSLNSSFNGNFVQTKNPLNSNMAAEAIELNAESSSTEIRSTKIFNGNPVVTREFTTIADNGEPEITIEACDSSRPEVDLAELLINVKEKKIHDIPKVASNIDNSKLQPLRIAIPAAFEALRKSTKIFNKNRQILVLRDGKLIPIDSANLGEKTVQELGPVSTVISGVKNVNSTNSGIQHAAVSLLKKSTIGTSIGKIMMKLNPKKSLIMNSTNNIPALKIVEPINTEKLFLVEKKMPHRTTVGILSKTKNNIKESTRVEHWLDKYKVVSRRIGPLAKDKIGMTSKRDYYEEILRSIDDARITDVSALVRFIIRRFPLVTERATDPEYRNLHPYASSSEKEFLDYNVGKQRALEWYRAKRVKSFLKKKGIPDEQHWTVKEIMIWSRLHGHTPIRSMPNVAVRSRNIGEKTSEKNPPGDGVERSPCTFTEPTGLLEYFRNAREAKAADGVTKNFNNEMEIIDVENIAETTEKNTEERDNDVTERRTIISLGIPEKIVSLQSYICDTTRQIGIKLEPEEIVPGVTHCAPARMMVRALQCLLEDLLRSSLAKAWERSSDGGCPDTITPEDVRGAILNREEFDVFTNEGLGSHHCPDD